MSPEWTLAGRRVLVTGGSGFLGSHVVIELLKRSAESVLNVDVLSYAADQGRLRAAESDSRYAFRQADVADHAAMRALFAKFRPDIVLHLAAETAVTRSEIDPNLFYRSNFEGTRSVMDAAAAAGCGRFVYVSTDKVYGSVESGVSYEGDRRPGTSLGLNDYTESKVAADDLVVTEATLPWNVLRPANVFGPWQYPEKSFARWTVKALMREPVPVWGDGGYIRQWLYRDDFTNALMLVLARGSLHRLQRRSSPRPRDDQRRGRPLHRSIR